jgi:yersiniabactin nonribosomal peptide synthetase
MQQAYWIGSRESSIGAVGAQYYVEFDGEGPEADRLQLALTALLRRHPLLRAARLLTERRQQIMRESQWGQITLHRFHHLSDQESAEQLLHLRQILAHRPLAVESSEVFDVQLSRPPSGHSRLHMMISMLVADARSFQIILSDLAALYVGG